MARMFSRHLQVTSDDRSLVTGSFAFVLHLVLNALSIVAGGGSLVLIDRFHPELALSAIRQHRITLLMSVPTAYVHDAQLAGGRGKPPTFPRSGLRFQPAQASQPLCISVPRAC